MLKVRSWLLLILAVLGLSLTAVAQRNREKAVPLSPAGEASLGNLPDSLRYPPDSLRFPPDTARAADSLGVDSLTVQPTGDIKTTVKYSARDSIRFDVTQQKVFLYGEGKVEYGTIALKADTMEINWETNTLDARGGRDSTGRKQGTPEFTDAGEQYAADQMRYNFKSRKGIISGVVTQEGDGYLHGQRVKKNEDNELFVRHARYTTCNLEHPHFFINASRVKVLPGDKIISGPFNMVIADIPTPVGLPFGLFPTPKRQASGIVVPVYGESRDLGFFLREGGFYWAVNDYIGVRLTGSIWSRGSYGIESSTSYKKRYAFNGSSNFRYNKRIEGDEGFENVGEDFWIQWSHAPESRRSSRFAVSVNAGTSNFNRRNAVVVQDYLNNSFTSSISYNKTFEGTPFNLALSARQSQNTTSGIMSFTLPQATLAMNRVQPFKPKGGAARTWYEKIGISYNFDTRNEISNQPVARRFPFPTIGDQLLAGERTIDDSVLTFNRENLPAILARNQVVGTHNIPVSTTFNVLKYISVSPNLSYREFWYLQRLDFRYEELNDSIRGVQVDTTRGFSRAYEYSAGVGFNTAIYGIYQFGRDKRVQAIRHVVRPVLNFNVRPDFSDPRFGFYQTVRADTTARATEQPVSRFFGLPGPAPGRSGTVGFSLTNQIEAKVRSRSDTATKPEKIVLIDNIGFSTNYNLAADSLNLSVISFNVRTRVRMFDVNVTSTLDPYVYRVIDDFNPGGVRVNEFAWNNGQGIGRITNANLSIGTNFNPEAFRRDREVQNQVDDPTLSEEEQAQARFIAANPDLYVDFNIPWSLRISYNLNYSRVGFNPQNITQALSFSGDLKLSEKWKVGFNSSYDVVNSGFGFTSLNIFRDLHCWEMAINWIPFGFQQSYSFELRAKASMLQDLKLNRRRSWIDRPIL